MTTPEIVAALLVALQVVVSLAAAVVVSLRRKPTTAIAWILTIVFVPYLGAVAFFFVGLGRLPRRRREKQSEVNALMLARSGVTEHLSVPGEPAWLSTAVTLNRNLGALPMVAGSSAALLDDYVGTLDAMIADVDQAVDHVHVEFYILVLDPTTKPFFDALARAVERGVTVRVLSDHLSGLMGAHRKETQDHLASIGAQWHAMLPLRPHRRQWQRPDLRNHRKLVVVDGRVGYTGSQNLIDDTYLKPKNVRRGLHWIELMVRFEGPVVGELDAVFVTDWYSETDELLTVEAHEHTGSAVRTLPTRGEVTVTEMPRGGELPAAEVPETSRPSGVGDLATPRPPDAPPTLTTVVEGVDAQVVPSGPSFENDNTLKLFTLLIHNARERVSITSPYFVPDESTLLAITTAASRGLDVELFVSEIGDQALVFHAQRSYYSALLAAGVKIYLYRAPTVLHSKHFSIDDDVAVIGSSNMDIRSFSLNMEVSVLVRSRGLVDRLRLVEDGYRDRSTRLDADEWAARPLSGKVRDGLARLTSALQ